MFIIEGYDPYILTWFYLDEFANEEDAKAFVKKTLRDDANDPFLTSETRPSYYVRNHPSELFCNYPSAETRLLFKQLAI